jgi:hypothetical protein
MIQSFRYVARGLLVIPIEIRRNFCSATVFSNVATERITQKENRHSPCQMFPHFKELSPFWQADSHLSQFMDLVTYHSLWILRAHCHVYNSLPLDHILCQINPIHILTHRCFKVYFNIIVSSAVVAPKLSLPSTVSDWHVMWISSNHRRITHVTHFILELFVLWRKQLVINALIGF